MGGPAGGGARTGLLSSMNARSPCSTVLTDHIGFQVSGWKSDIDRQIFALGLKRPFGVIMRMLGGLYGYSFGNVSAP